MLIEATQPLRVRLPEGDLRLIPGQPVELPEDQARRLLAKAPGKVRSVEPTRKALPTEGQAVGGAAPAETAPLWALNDSFYVLLPTRTAMGGLGMSRVFGVVLHSVWKPEGRWYWLYTQQGDLWVSESYLTSHVDRATTALT